MDNSELSERDFISMTKIIKIISESVKTYIENEPSTTKGSDISLYAMQVLSLICVLNRGYSKSQIDQMWAMSNKLSNKLHSLSKGDKVESPFQSAVSSRYKN